mgnify:CR=1 FL=1
MTTELLAPAGGQEALVAAVQSGADAVYMGFGAFNARRSARNFSDEEFRAAVSYCHLRGVKVYLTLNTLVTDRELPALAAEARTASECGVDAILVQDWGVLATLQKIIPDVPLHASTQMSLHTLSGVQEAARLGMTRAVLARELNREEIAEICQKSPIEIETFVHGALCMCYSGQCEMSAVIGRRSGNRGACAQPCRYQYALMEEKRPGEYFPVFEDEKGTYIMNSRDMCMIDHLDDIMDAGIDCIKIEGRAKSAYYAAIVTGAYRHVLDDVAAGREVDPVWRDEVEHVSHRHYSTGFYYGQPGQYYDNSRYIRDWQVCAVVTDCDADGNATLSLRNKFAAGDEIELVGPDSRPFTMTAPVMHDLEGFELYEPRTPQTVFKMKLPRYVPPMSFVRHAVSLSAKD